MSSLMEFALSMSRLRCRECGLAIARNPGPGRNPRYCSSRCKAAAADAARGCASARSAKRSTRRNLIASGSAQGRVRGVLSGTASPDCRAARPGQRRATGPGIIVNAIWMSGTASARNAGRRSGLAAPPHRLNSGAAGTASGRIRGGAPVREASASGIRECAICAARPTFQCGTAGPISAGARSRVLRRGATAPGRRTRGSLTAITSHGSFPGTGGVSGCARRPTTALPTPRSSSATDGGAVSAVSGSGSRSSTRIRALRALTM